MDESNTPKKTPRSRAVTYIVVAVCVVAVLLAVFFLKPAPANTQSQASADTNQPTVAQRLDPFQISNYLGINITEFTYGYAEGQDYQVEPADSNTNRYIFASSIGYLGIADEQDHTHLYADSATKTVNKSEYQAVVPQTEKDAFLSAFSVKMNDLESVFGNTYETLYLKDSQAKNGETGYTYQKIYDALTSGQAGIYTINWSQNGFQITLKVDNVTDPKNYALSVSFWSYANAVSSATP